MKALGVQRWQVQWRGAMERVRSLAKLIAFTSCIEAADVSASVCVRKLDNTHVSECDCESKFAKRSQRICNYIISQKRDTGTCADSKRRQRAVKSRQRDANREENAHKLTRGGSARRSGFADDTNRTNENEIIK